MLISVILFRGEFHARTCPRVEFVEAVEAADAFRPRLVLLDIGMPQMNGFEAARRIREQPWGKDLVLVALTGWGQEADKRKALEAGFDHHLTKPTSPEELETLLASL